MPIPSGIFNEDLIHGNVRNLMYFFLLIFVCFDFDF